MPPIGAALYRWRSAPEPTCVAWWPRVRSDGSPDDQDGPDEQPAEEITGKGSVLGAFIPPDRHTPHGDYRRREPGERLHRAAHEAEVDPRLERRSLANALETMHPCLDAAIPGQRQQERPDPENRRKQLDGPSPAFACAAAEQERNQADAADQRQEAVAEMVEGPVRVAWTGVAPWQHGTHDKNAEPDQPDDAGQVVHRVGSAPESFHWRFPRLAGRPDRSQLECAAGRL